MIGTVFLLLTTAIATWALTGGARKYALRRSLLDIPNGRASHTVPTPRGGGAAIVVAATLALMITPMVTGVEMLPAAAIAAGALVGVLGFIDDHRDVSPLVRLAAHVLLAIVAVTSIGAMPIVSIFGVDLAPGIGSEVISVLMVVWFINLTNFMDGIDGIASVQTMSVCAGIALLVWLTHGASGGVVGPLVLAAAVGGFLVWNWPPARIFMGDVGSGYLGFMTAAFIVVATAHDARLTWGAAILSGVFVVDATVTLFLRAGRRERLFQAHRSHAYQRLAIRWGAHKPVTLLCLAVNLGWLLPIASLVALRQVGGEIGLLVAWAPLAAGVLWVNHTE